jgi:hypothetical protein
LGLIEIWVTPPAASPRLGHSASIAWRNKRTTRWDWVRDRITLEKQAEANMTYSHPAALPATCPKIVKNRFHVAQCQVGRCALCVINCNGSEACAAEHGHKDDWSIDRAWHGSAGDLLDEWQPKDDRHARNDNANHGPGHAVIQLPTCTVVRSFLRICHDIVR